MSARNNLNHVKRIFESKTGVVLNAGKPVRRSARSAVVLVAAIACCLSITAFAANYFSGGVMADYFQRGAIGVQDNNNELSDQQLSVIEDYTTYINESVESKGIILTLKSVTASISSGNLNAYFVFEIEAPDGALNDIDDSSLTFENSSLDFEHKSQTSSSGSGRIESVMDDEQGRENVKTIVYVYSGSCLDFENRNMPATLVLNNLCTWKYTSRAETPSDAILKVSDLMNVVAEGEWSFDLNFNMFKESVELVKEPVMFPEYGYTLTTLQISSFGLYLSLDYLESEDTEDGIEPPLAFCNGIQVIMRDGSVIAADSFDQFGKPVESKNNNTMVVCGATIGSTNLLTSYYFDAPIDLSEADYIMFPDGTCIDIQ